MVVKGINWLDIMNLAGFYAAVCGKDSKIHPKFLAEPKITFNHCSSTITMAHDRKYI
jgi:hypothetical protein